ncbi:MAG TPA: hypothetical protein VFO12_02080 [Sphingomicrobium sp.]|nr:hypothetical protein [Sphingomicrobium sp.]
MKWLCAALLMAMPSVSAAQNAPTPLFANDNPIRLTIKGPIGAIARKAEDSMQPHEAMMTLAAPAEVYPIRLSARGLSRRKSGICQFPPLRVELAQPAPAGSLFAGQRRLKLVTHCRSSEGFQQHLLLEYSAYRIFNLISPLSYRARLATVDYVEANGKPITTRWGFLIEDLDDLARRNGLTAPRVADRIPKEQLEPMQGGRVALFQYMISNFDWSMRAGPAGEGCCHNHRLLAGGPKLVPVAYDFDYSGLVDAPYAVPPEGIKVNNVRDRLYRGYCIHNQGAVAAAAELRARRPAIEALYDQIPGMSPATQRKAVGFLSRFFNEIATDDSVRAKILKDCIG